MTKRPTTSRIIATNLLLLSLLLIFGSLCFAETEAGRVTHLSGPLFAKKADGTTRVLSINSVVEQGDILVTEKKTYARIKFTDGSEINMRPDTQLKISEYNFDQAKPKEDKATYNLFKGGMRAVTGSIGKRGDQNSYQLMTPSAVAGVRGTTYECKICEGNCGSIPNGLYLFVLEGGISVSNNAGSQNLSAGQYVYVQTMESIPQILPGNPGIDFTLPAFMGDSPKEGEANKAATGCIMR
ncbi:MAG TPA: FecR domain-containing protein [Syntrophales bacterium]|nr:FecR domain-containing protein [Syntrophales bacterium]